MQGEEGFLERQHLPAPPALPAPWDPLDLSYPAARRGLPGQLSPGLPKPQTHLQSPGDQADREGRPHLELLEYRLARLRPVLLEALRVPPVPGRQYRPEFRRRSPQLTRTGAYYGSLFSTNAHPSLVYCSQLPAVPPLPVQELVRAHFSLPGKIEDSLPDSAGLHERPGKW